VALPGFGRLTKNLPAGEHTACWAELEAKLGFNETRKQLLSGLLAGCRALKAACVTHVYVDGSFATKKFKPNDFDACYSIATVKSELLDPVFLDFSNERAAMKAKYKGEFFPAEEDADGLGTPYREFFQRDRQGRKKGIIVLDLSTLP
jgi:hypothetical protein